MQAVKQYTNWLEQTALTLASNLNSSATDKQKESLYALSNGKINHELRGRIPPAKKKQLGAFFTEHELAQVLLSELNIETDNCLFYDPACGSGDLLLECSAKLKVSKHLETTLAQWGETLHGSDINPYFVRLTKARLLISAICRGGYKERSLIVDLSKLFPNICVSDSLKENTHKERNACLVMNPPFGDMKAPKNCSWSSGSVARAAVFLDRFVNSYPDGVSILAILPDVLRTGSRYRKWRRVIEENTDIDNIVVYGQFDQWTDVDVFVIKLKINKQKGKDASSFNWHVTPESQISTVGTFFDVHVGSVVPHRDPETGRTYPFVFAKNLPPWQIIKKINDTRKYDGTVYKTPFVAIRRTSSPHDTFRAIGSVINCGQEIAVENHILVLSPKDKTITSCNKLIDVLRNPRTSSWLNSRIRCRHLTVSSIRDLPWWGD
jgi:hypothetical protein